MEPEEEQAYDLMGELTILDPKRLRIYTDAFGDLTLDMQIIVHIEIWREDLGFRLYPAAPMVSECESESHG